MIVDLRSISSEPRNYQLFLEQNWWGVVEKRDQIVGFDVPLQVNLEIYRAGDRFVFEGDLSGGLQVLCDRCLVAYHRDLKSSFMVFFTLPNRESEKTEIELAEDDLKVDFAKGGNVDLDQVIREQIYLSLPMKSLCKDDCLGICSVCGYDLNNGTCGCNRDQGHPGFQKLKNLKIQGE
jgi:uncharacterized protein